MELLRRVSLRYIVRRFDLNGTMFVTEIKYASKRLIMEGIYKIKLVPSDLNVEETILQIADTLDNLNGIVDDVFSRLTARIKQNMDTTSKLHARIEASRCKVDKLTGMQKAIKVFSSAKYPAAITHEHYQSVFDADGYEHKPKKVTLSSKTQGQTNEKELQVRFEKDFTVKTVVFHPGYSYEKYILNFRRNSTSSM